MVDNIVYHRFARPYMFINTNTFICLYDICDISQICIKIFTAKTKKHVESLSFIGDILLASFQVILFVIFELGDRVLKAFNLDVSLETVADIFRRRSMLTNPFDVQFKYHTAPSAFKFFFTF